MMFKRSFQILVVCLLVLPVMAEELILVDKIAASVNDEIITLSDIDKALRFYSLGGGTGGDEEKSYAEMLEVLIDHKVVYLEHRETSRLEPGDYDRVQTAVIEKLGSLGQLNQLLRQFDMDWADFKAFIRERVVYEKVVKKKLREKISIDFKDIETYYNEQYLPRQEELELEALSLIEMAPGIQEHLRKERSRAMLSQWLKEMRTSYKIENKL